MITCPNCHCQNVDNALFCTVCGTPIGVTPQFHAEEGLSQAAEHKAEFEPQPVDAPIIPLVDPYDHTADFSSGDISENKVAAMLLYLLGPLGIVIALLSSGNSRYAAFHVRQAMKLTVAEILGIILLAVLSFLLWNLRLRVLMLFVAALFLAGIAILHLLCFLQVCKGRAVEVYLVRNLQFLK